MISPQAVNIRAYYGVTNADQTSWIPNAARSLLDVTVSPGIFDEGQRQVNIPQQARFLKQIQRSVELQEGMRGVDTDASAPGSAPAKLSPKEMQEKADSYD